jgi:hypothetical protein
MGSLLSELTRLPFAEWPAWALLSVMSGGFGTSLKRFPVLAYAPGVRSGQMACGVLLQVVRLNQCGNSTRYIGVPSRGWLESGCPAPYTDLSDHARNPPTLCARENLRELIFWLSGRLW